MRKLVLVRHSLPEIAADEPAAQWRLSDAGRSLCGSLSDRLQAYEPLLIVSSAEPKAVETAEIVARRLGVDSEATPGLHEHDRSGSTDFLSKERFEQTVAELFDRPDELVMGRETAAQARDRFVGAVQDVIEGRLNESVAIVAHGTVMSLFVANYTDQDPFELWRRLGLPSFVVLSPPELKLESVVEAI